MNTGCRSIPGCCLFLRCCSGCGPAADGPDGYGSTIAYNPTFIVEDFFDFDAIERRSFPFDVDVTARYVELTPTRNYFDDPGDGTGLNGWGAGGDRVGIGENNANDG